MNDTHTLNRHWQRARTYLRSWQLPAARAQFESLQRLAPTDVRTCLLGAVLAWHGDHVRESAARALDAATRVPDDAGLLAATVEALLQAGESAAAHTLLSHPAWQNANDVEALTAYAGFLQDFNQPAAALAVLDRLAVLQPGNAALQLFRGQQLEYLGRLDEAEACYLDCLRRDPGCGRAAYWLARLPHAALRHDLQPIIETGLQAATRGTLMHAAFEFARYHAHETHGQYGEAWDALARGNAEMRAACAPAGGSQGVEMQRFVASLALHPPVAPARAADSPCPIFIVGLPRSGTTLLERMLSNHSQVATAGERVDFGNALLWGADTRLLFGEAFLSRVPNLDWPQVGQHYLAQVGWQARGKPYLIDKRPTNWTIAGLIHCALPQARIINVVRDAMDVSFGNWRALFGDAYPWVYGFADLARQHHDYIATMRHWHARFPGAILDVAYADLVQDPAATLHRVFDFCGLPWEAGCEDPRRNASPVTTLSSAQVRGPIDTHGIGRWRRYAMQLEPLRRLLQPDIATDAVTKASA